MMEVDDNGIVQADWAREGSRAVDEAVRGCNERLPADKQIRLVWGYASEEAKQDAVNAGAWPVYQSGLLEFDGTPFDLAIVPAEAKFAAMPSFKAIKLHVGLRLEPVIQIPEQIDYRRLLELTQSRNVTPFVARNQDGEETAVVERISITLFADGVRTGHLMYALSYMSWAWWEIRREIGQRPKGTM